METNKHSGVISIYFGQKREGTSFGFGCPNSSDMVDIKVSDIEKVCSQLTHEEWVCVSIGENNFKYINTNNILWFDAVCDKKETDDE